MSEKTDGVKKKFSKNPNAKHRRRNALIRLEDQLKRDYKIVKVPGEDAGQNVALTDKDKKRIEKEIEILKERI